MFGFIFKNLTVQHGILDLKNHYIRYLQTLPSLNSISKPTDQQSLTLSFLTNSCGLSLEKAISTSKIINIKDLKKPNSALQLLTSHGFTKSHIATLVSKNPCIIMADSEKNLKPKIEYFESVGIVGLHLPKFLCSDQRILSASLENRVIPNFDFLKGFVQTNENLIFALKNSTRIIYSNIEKQMMPNINTLRALKVPEPHIGRLIISRPNTLLKSVDSFKNMVDEIKEMGFEPRSKSFLLAIGSMSRLSKATWEIKKKTLMGFGWSEREFYLAFRKQPLLMVCSEKKISKLMEFFVTKVGLKPSDVAGCPNILLVSFERRIIPRWSVLTFLMSKKLLTKDVNVISSLNISKNPFEKRFVTNYMDDFPEVMRVYQNGVGLGDLIP